MINRDKTAKIGIIGAGPAGLAAAEALMETGYEDITILEKKNRAGGQALSIPYIVDGEQLGVYELGSLQPISGKKLNHLIKKYGLDIGKEPFGRKPIRLRLYSINEKRYILDFFKHPITGYPFKFTWLWLHDTITLVRQLIKFHRLKHPGFSYLSPEQTAALAIPYKEWVRSLNFKLLGHEMERMIEMIITYINPEQAKELPALVALKFITQISRHPQTYINGTIKQMKQGHQELWNRVARNKKIIFNCSIKKIIRTDKSILITTVDNEYNFDKLIITCSPKEFLSFLDTTDTEREYFSNVTYNPGWRAAFIAKGFPTDAFYAFVEPYDFPDFPIKVQTIIPEIKIDNDTWLFTCTIAKPNCDNIESELATITEFLAQNFNCKIVKWLKSIYWPEYSPLFSRQQVSAGIYNKIEAMQGQKNTYYAGGLISGGTHPVVTDYAYDLVKKYF